MNRTVPVTGLLLTALLAGCLSVQPAGPASGNPSPSRAADGPRATDSIWPERWGDGDGPKGVVVELPEPHTAYVGRRVGRFHDQLAGPEDERLVARLASGRASPAGYRYRLERPGAYVFVSTGRGDRSADVLPPSRRPRHRLVFLSGEVDERPETQPGEPEDRVVVQRTWGEFFEHRREARAPEPGDAGRGTVVIAPGLFGVPEPVIRSIVQAIRHAGWNVLRVLAPPSRFTERAEIEMVEVDAENPEAPRVTYTAERFAEHSDTRIAEYAYAVEAMLAWLRERHHERFPAPSPLIAMSAGAMSGPAIVSRAPTLIGPVLLIAGGGDILSVTARSSYTPLIDAVRFTWAADLPGLDDPVGLGPGARDAVVDALVDDYLAAAPLDPLNLAPGLADRPVVMLHGTNDTAVPAADGDRLWEALGRPERWVTPLDHGPLFVGLFLWTPRILGWLEREDGG